jgi:hypothetical protein
MAYCSSFVLKDLQKMPFLHAILALIFLFLGAIYDLNLSCIDQRVFFFFKTGLRHSGSKVFVY